MPVAAHFVTTRDILWDLIFRVMCAVVQDNRESGENPERSRRCVSGVFFQPKGSHCENGNTKEYDDAKVRRPAFLFVIIRFAMYRFL